MELYSLLGKEALLGLVVGFVVSLFFWSAEMVGFLVDKQRWGSMASAMDPLYGESSSPTGVLLLQLVTVLFLLLVDSWCFWRVFLRAIVRRG
jgi:type III secretion protein T